MAILQCLPLEVKATVTRYPPAPIASTSLLTPQAHSILNSIVSSARLQPVPLSTDSSHTPTLLIVQTRLKTYVFLSLNWPTVLATRPLMRLPTSSLLASNALTLITSTLRPTDAFKELILTLTARPITSTLTSVPFVLETHSLILVLTSSALLILAVSSSATSTLQCQPAFNARLHITLKTMHAILHQSL